MNVTSVSISKFLKNKENFYKNVMIVARRSRQIIDNRYLKIQAMQNIEDTDQLETIYEDEVIEPKSISVAMQEFLNNDLEYRNIGDEDKESDNE